MYIFIFSYIIKQKNIKYEFGSSIKKFFVSKYLFFLLFKINVSAKKKRINSLVKKLIFQYNIYFLSGINHS